MKFGLIVYGDLKTLTGGYLYDRRLTEHLRQSGHEVEVFSLPVRAYGMRLLDNFQADLFGSILDSSVDVLLQDELCHPSLIRLNGKLGRKASPPIVSIVHHPLSSEPRAGWQNRLLGVLEKRYLNSVKAFIFNSEATRRRVSQLTGTDRPHVVARPAGDRLGGGRSPSDLEKRSYAAGPLRLLHLGAVIPRKGLHLTVEALQALSPEKWRLTVVGDLKADSKYVEGLRRSLNRRGLSGQVTFRGVLPEPDLREALSRSHLLFMPYAYEGFGIVYAEGMAYGLPAVGSRSGGAAEAIRHGGDGYLVAPRDRAAPKRIVEECHRNRGRLLEMSKAALDSFHSQPTWRDAMQEVERFLLTLRR